MIKINWMELTERNGLTSYKANFGVKNTFYGEYSRFILLIKQKYNSEGKLHYELYYDYKIYYNGYDEFCYEYRGDFYYVGSDICLDKIKKLADEHYELFTYDLYRVKRHDHNTWVLN